MTAGKKAETKRDEDSERMESSFPPSPCGPPVYLHTGCNTGQTQPATYESLSNE